MRKMKTAGKVPKQFICCRRRPASEMGGPLHGAWAMQGMWVETETESGMFRASGQVGSKVGWEYGVR
jgi:hypothetical protein